MHSNSIIQEMNAFIKHQEFLLKCEDIGATVHRFTSGDASITCDTVEIENKLKELINGTYIRTDNVNV